MRSPKSVVLSLALAGALVSQGTNAAAIWEQPTDVLDNFRSHGLKVLILDIPRIFVGQVEFFGTGPTTVVRDCIGPGESGGDCDREPFEQNERDTINTEMVALHLTGQIGGLHTEIRAGLGWSFFEDGVGLDHSRGQIQDTDAPANGAIDFPADSFFDIFFDVWIDLDGDGDVSLGEVLSNDVRGVSSALSYALRMAVNPPGSLLGVPPPPGTVYFAFGKVSASDSAIGTFDAEVLAIPLDLYFIDAARDLLEFQPGRVLVIGAVHEIVPEPGSLALLGLGLGALALVRRRRRQG